MNKFLAVFLILNIVGQSIASPRFRSQMKEYRRRLNGDLHPRHRHLSEEGQLNLNIDGRGYFQYRLRVEATDASEDESQTSAVTSSQDPSLDVFPDDSLAIPEWDNSDKDRGAKDPEMGPDGKLYLQIGEIFGERDKQQNGNNADNNRWGDEITFGASLNQYAYSGLSMLNKGDNVKIVAREGYTCSLSGDYQIKQTVIDRLDKDGTNTGSRHDLLNDPCWQKDCTNPARGTNSFKVQRNGDLNPLLVGVVDPLANSNSGKPAIGAEYGTLTDVSNCLVRVTAAEPSDGTRDLYERAFPTTSPVIPANAADDIVLDADGNQWIKVSAQSGNKKAQGGTERGATDPWNNQCSTAYENDAGSQSGSYDDGNNKHPNLTPNTNPGDYGVTHDAYDRSPYNRCDRELYDLILGTKGKKLYEYVDDPRFEFQTNQNAWETEVNDDESYDAMVADVIEITQNPDEVCASNGNNCCLKQEQGQQGTSIPENSAVYAYAKIKYLAEEGEGSNFPGRNGATTVDKNDGTPGRMVVKLNKDLKEPGACVARLVWRQHARQAEELTGPIYDQAYSVESKVKVVRVDSNSDSVVLAQRAPGLAKRQRVAIVGQKCSIKGTYTVKDLTLPGTTRVVKFLSQGSPLNRDSKIPRLRADDDCFMTFHPMQNANAIANEMGQLPDGMGVEAVQDGDPKFFTQVVYSRDGSLHINKYGYLCDDNGLLLISDGTHRSSDPNAKHHIHVPSRAEDILVTPTGKIMAVELGGATFSKLGQIMLARFENPQGLNIRLKMQSNCDAANEDGFALGNWCQGTELDGKKHTYMSETDVSGPGIVGKPGEQGFGRIVR
jgi:hypothetical protein